MPHNDQPSDAQNQEATAHARTPALPLRAIGAAGLGAALVLGAAGVAVASMNGAEVVAAALGAVSAAIGCLLGIAAMTAIGTSDPMKVPTAVLAGSTVRLIGSLAIAGVTYMITGPAAAPFWGAFLAAALAALLAETLVAAKSLRATQTQAASTNSTLNGASSA
ncbi:MAG: hypothetical protein AAGG07_01765 [Planctomycetota bacterium]